MTDIEASIGWNYVVLNYQRYGLGSVSHFKINLEVRNNKTKSLLGLSQSWTKIDILDRISDDSTVNSYDLIGHRGIKAKL